MSGFIDLQSSRARQARLGLALGKRGYPLLLACGSLALAAAIVFFMTSGPRYGLWLLSLALIFGMPAIWWKKQLSVLPPAGNDLTGRLSVDVLARLRPGEPQQPQSVWAALSGHWQAAFFMRHLLVDQNMVATTLGSDPAELNQALGYAVKLADNNGSPVIELGFVVAGLMLASSAFQQLLIQIKAQPADVEAIANWMGRKLAEDREVKRDYGGIGRDWAFGFTPLLDRFGENISLSIAQHGVRFGSLAKSQTVLNIEAAFNNHATAVVLVGPEGIGKSNSVYALAQRLIEGNTVPSLAYHQVVGLNATNIISHAQQQGELERIMLGLAHEAARAGHIILFLDDAQLFISEGTGSFDASQILLSIVQERSTPIILAMMPHDYQRLKTRNQSLAGLLTPVILQELPEADVIRVLEDATVGLEHRHQVTIAYEAMREAYRLSGRYEQDEAYPGKAIKLLEQAVTHSQNGFVTAASVQEAIEQTRGVKAGNAAPAEADTLLHLEDNIHRRMINQTHAVGVVANALRRARAGVTNPKRPIGSFLFLGPTGVGKTELAKSVAATYFGSEDAMVRLDMSEYQQPDDVQRLLSTGAEDNSSLLMLVREQPFSVVLLDEIEKAHPNILNLLLQLLDEGQLTDASGRAASFKDCVIIATSNAGAAEIRERVGRGETLESFAAEFTDQLINSGQFKPELLNRFDEMVLFRPLKPEELVQVVQLMINEVNQTLANQNIALDLTPAAIQKIVEQGNDPRLGARPMRRMLQRAVEDTVAQKILRGEAKPGDRLTLDAPDLAL